MGKKYNIIYADPPWQYKVYSKKGEGRSAENHYHTMNIEDIKSLPVESIADDDCILFLWITFPCLLEGIAVMESWGFTCHILYTSNIDSLMSLPSISSPRQSHPSNFCLANSSIRGRSPHSSTILSRNAAQIYELEAQETVKAPKEKNR